MSEVQLADNQAKQCTSAAVCVSEDSDVGEGSVRTGREAKVGVRGSGARTHITVSLVSRRSRCNIFVAPSPQPTSLFSLLFCDFFS